jgi:predicted dehydrogenase
MQRRSMDFVRRARSAMPELGKICLVQARWNWAFRLPLENDPLGGELAWDLFLGNAPQRPPEPRRFRWWRGFWDYSGGNMTDQGTHLMDVVQWMTDSPPPLAATCSGQIVQADCEVPNVFTTIFEYPAFSATWTLNYRSSYDNDWSIAFHGANGAMFMDRRGYRIYRNLAMTSQPWRAPDRPELSSELPDTSSQTAHQQNFLDCIASRKEPNCPVEAAASAVAGPHMANISWRERRRVTRPA